MDIIMGNCGTDLSIQEQDMVKQFVGFLGDAMSGNFEVFFGGECPLKNASVDVTPLKNTNYAQITPCMLIKAVKSDTKELLFVSLYTKDFLRTLINAVTGGDPSDIKTIFDDFDIGTSGEILGQVFNTFGSSVSLTFSQTVPAINAEVVECNNYGDLVKALGCGSDEMVVTLEGSLECDGFAKFPILVTTPVSFIKKTAITLGVTPKVAPAPAPAPVEVAPMQQPMQAAPVDMSNDVMYQAPQTMLRPALTRASMDLLMNIPLEISVQIGSTQRKIKDIVDFTNGTVIEINKEVTQPVDVLANNKLIAHGEIVVIEDNFGLRITEVLDMKELIASFQNGD